MSKTETPRDVSAGSPLGAVVGGVKQFWSRIAALDAPTQIALVVLVAGAGLRLWHFASGRSLWLDEAMVAASIANRDWAGLLQPLDYGQVAPVGWLFLEKAAFEMFGGADFALRLPQFVFGFASLFLFAAVARRMLSPWGFAVAAALFALSPQLIRFSAEVKPYGADVLVAVLALAYGVRLLARGEALKWADWLGLLLFGALAVTLSFPAAFILAGLGGMLFLREAMSRRAVSALGIAAISVAWLAVFAALNFGLQERAESNVVTMQTEWDDSFAPLPPASAADMKWYVQTLFGMIDYLFGNLSAVAGLLAALVGMVLLLRGKILFAGALIAPVVVALVASGLHLYPFRDRLLLFLLPGLLVLVGVGVQAVATQVTPSWRAALGAFALLGFGSLASLWGEYTYFPRPFGTEHIEPVLREIAQRRRPDEPIYVDHASLPAFRHYQQRTGLGDAEIIEGRVKQGDPRCLLADMERVAAHSRAWVLYSHSSPMLGLREEGAFVYFASAAARQLHAIPAHNVQAFLYEFRPDAAERLAALRQALPVGDCSL